MDRNRAVQLHTTYRVDILQPLVPQKLIKVFNKPHYTKLMVNR